VLGLPETPDRKVDRPFFFPKRVKKEQLLKWSREKPSLTIRGRWALDRDEKGSFS
jgi:hypothetical protein